MGDDNDKRSEKCIALLKIATVDAKHPKGLIIMLVFNSAVWRVCCNQRVCTAAVPREAALLAAIHGYCTSPPLRRLAKLISGDAGTGTATTTAASSHSVCHHEIRPNNPSSSHVCSLTRAQPRLTTNGTAEAGSLEE
jgi:hypothetical protein